MLLELILVSALSTWNPVYKQGHFTLEEKNGIIIIYQDSGGVMERERDQRVRVVRVSDIVNVEARNNQVVIILRNTRTYTGASHHVVLNCHQTKDLARWLFEAMAKDKE